MGGVLYLQKNMETNKIIDRIVRELTKNDSAQPIVDNCQSDLLEYFYWEYKQTKWMLGGYLAKANAHFKMALQAIQERDEIINEQNKILSRLEIKNREDQKAFVDILMNTHELAEEVGRQEMLLNIKEQFK